MPDFVDHVVLHARAGRGGDGCTSIRREKFVPLGGPDGGNGGDGGSVVLEVDASVKTLLDYHRRPHRRARAGRPGQGGGRHGAAGADLVLRVPSGTVIRTTTSSELVADLVTLGERHVLVRGGKGGLGNAALASPRRRAPGFALKGEPGEELDVVLELKVVADVGLVGFPNAGKSSLIAGLSAARPKIANYPFTTLVPNLGVVQAGAEQFVVADVPGLIPGASQGKGLGFTFLRHVERCSTLVHVLDCATAEPGRDPVSDFDAVEAELAAYGILADRPRLVVLNKVDVPDGRELAELVRPDFEGRGLPTHETSAASGEGLRALAFAMAELVRAARAAEPEQRGAAPKGRAVGKAEPRRPVIRPRPLGEPGFEVVRTGDNRYAVRGEKPTRWIRQTDFGNDEAVGYLADRLARLGVEEALADAGARPGAEVVVGDGDDAVVFDWDPSTPAGVGRRHGPRGTDSRLEGRQR